MFKNNVNNYECSRKGMEFGMFIVVSGIRYDVLSQLVYRVFELGKVNQYIILQFVIWLVGFLFVLLFLLKVYLVVWLIVMFFNFFIIVSYFYLFI